MLLKSYFLYDFNLNILPKRKVDFHSDWALSTGARLCESESSTTTTGCWSRRRYHRMWCF